MYTLVAAWLAIIHIWLGRPTNAFGLFMDSMKKTVNVLKMNVFKAVQILYLGNQDVGDQVMEEVILIDVCVNVWTEMGVKND